MSGTNTKLKVAGGSSRQLVAMSSATKAGSVTNAAMSNPLKNLYQPVANSHRRDAAALPKLTPVAKMESELYSTTGASTVASKTTANSSRQGKSQQFKENKG